VSPAPAQRPGGVVKLVVGDIGRAGSRSRKAAMGGGPPAATAPDVRAWCCTWSDEGPTQVSAECAGEPDLSLSLSAQDATEVQAGRLAPSVAFMQGRLKTAGDNALLLQVLEWTASPAFGQALGQLP
jgi:hypothetical protein